MLGTSALRVLRREDLAAARAVLARNPVADVFVASRVESLGVDTRFGGEMWGYCVEGRLESLCHAGANLIPVQASREAAVAFAERAKRQGRKCASIVGERDAVAAMWDVLEPAWGPARDVRPNQPLLVIDSAPLIDPDPLVRPVRPDELDVLFPACVAMFTEEVGISPTGTDGGAMYKARVAQLIGEGHAFARIEDGRVLFKAEVGSAAGGACQLQGVWVPPELRGRGMSAPGMAAVVSLAQERIAPVVSLYVNDYNVPARASYQRVGFEQRGTFMSVLF